MKLSVPLLASALLFAKSISLASAKNPLPLASTNKPQSFAKHSRGLQNNGNCMIADLTSRVQLAELDNQALCATRDSSTAALARTTEKHHSSKLSVYPVVTATIRAALGYIARTVQIAQLATALSLQLAKDALVIVEAIAHAAKFAAIVLAARSLDLLSDFFLFLVTPLELVAGFWNAIATIEVRIWYEARLESFEAAYEAEVSGQVCLGNLLAVQTKHDLLVASVIQERQLDCAQVEGGSGGRNLFFSFFDFVPSFFQSILRFLFPFWFPESNAISGIPDYSSNEGSTLPAAVVKLMNDVVQEVDEAEELFIPEAATTDVLESIQTLLNDVNARDEQKEKDTSVAVQTLCCASKAIGVDAFKVVKLVDKFVDAVELFSCYLKSGVESIMNKIARLPDLIKDQHKFFSITKTFTATINWANVGEASIVIEWGIQTTDRGRGVKHYEVVPTSRTTVAFGDAATSPDFDAHAPPVLESGFISILDEMVTDCKGAFQEYLTESETCQDLFPNGGFGEAKDDCCWNADCQSNKCVNYVDSLFDPERACTDGQDESPCEFDSDCESGRCEFTCEGPICIYRRCAPKLEAGQPCNENDDCLSHSCGKGLCFVNPLVQCKCN